jgi:hypothetical protein
VFALVCALGTLIFAFRRWSVSGSSTVSDADIEMVEQALRDAE